MVLCHDLCGEDDERTHDPRDKMRKVGGDLAADGFLKAMGTTSEALSLSVAERR